jgi:hypothetical protein
MDARAFSVAADREVSASAERRTIGTQVAEPTRTGTRFAPECRSRAERSIAPQRDHQSGFDLGYHTHRHGIRHRKDCCIANAI